MKSIIATLAFAGITLASSASVYAADARPVQGPVIMARGGSNAVYLWNATPYVTQLVNDKMLGANGLRALEASAVSALGEKARDSKAATVSIRVVYERSGAVSQAYGTPTFAGLETVFVMSASRADAAAREADWVSQFSAGKTPKGLKVEMHGKLPPQ